MQSIRLNMVPTGVMPHLYCSQYDVGRKFHLQLYDGSEEHNIASDETVTIQGCKPDHHVFTYGSKDKDPIVTVDGSGITITTTQQMTAIDGEVNCELVLSKGTQIDGNKEQVISTINFVLDIEKCPVPEDGDSSASDLRTYIEMVEDAKEAIKRAIEIEEELKRRAGSHVSMQMTLQASKWTGSSAPYSYDFGNDFSDRAFVVAPADTASAEQVEDWYRGNILGGKGTVMYARGFKPTMDIPVNIIYIRLF